MTEIVALLSALLVGLILASGLRASLALFLAAVAAVSTLLLVAIWRDSGGHDGSDWVLLVPPLVLAGMTLVAAASAFFIAIGGWQSRAAPAGIAVAMCCSLGLAVAVIATARTRCQAQVGSFWIFTTGDLEECEASIRALLLVVVALSTILVMAASTGAALAAAHLGDELRRRSTTDSRG